MDKPNDPNYKHDTQNTGNKNYPENDNTENKDIIQVTLNFKRKNLTDIENSIPESSSRTLDPSNKIDGHRNDNFENDSHGVYPGFRAYSDAAAAVAAAAIARPISVSPH